MSLRIALASCRVLPEPDPDQPLLEAHLRGRGHHVETIPWDAFPASAEGDERWAAFDLCVLRSTWDYHRRLPEFLAWVERAAACTRLINPAALVRRNSHKRYLTELAAQGVAVVPTEVVTVEAPRTLEEVLAARDWDELVIKPAVSAGSFGTIRAHRDAPDAGAAHLAELLGAGEDVLIQPYQASVEGHGERAIVTFDGAPSHAVRKSPRFSSDDESVELVAIEPDEAELARAIVAQIGAELGEAPAYARVDLARDGEGRPQVMELELIEPSLFFVLAPHALDPFAAALERRAEAPC